MTLDSETPRTPEAQRMVEEVSRAVEEVWPIALADWSSFLLLGKPAVTLDPNYIAFIDLSTRRMSVSAALVKKHGLLGAMEAILAHEVGHHVKYPATLAVQARLAVLEKSILPDRSGSQVNLFTDLLINAGLPEHLHPQTMAIYRSFAGPAAERGDHAFLFYVAVFEAVFGLTRGALLGSGLSVLEERFPAYPPDARALGVELFHLGPNIYTQFVYFISIFKKYLQDQEEVRGLGCGCGDPSHEDWAEALEPSPKEKEAIERARERGWIRDDVARRALHGARNDGVRRDSVPPNRRPALPEIMAAWYRREAEKHLFQPPPVVVPGEPLVPLTTEEWEPGDPLPAIDWTASVRRYGPALGGALPLKRERAVDEEGQESLGLKVRMEIYLDVSSSMPNPLQATNAMTLAAQILVMGAIRAGGFVRALMYSDEAKLHWNWSRSEREMSRFLMGYIGSGTNFPYEVLERSVAECGAHQPIRVVISDPDFDSNFEAKARSGEHAEILRSAVRPGAPLVLVQHLAGENKAEYRSLGVRVVVVENMKDFPAMAAQLSRSLFDGMERRSRG